MMNTTCYRLVVCEKPSVARSIAAVLGAGRRGDGFLSGGGYLVSWCFGHLAELSDADAYDEKYGKWRREDLPILPESWQYNVARDKQKQMNTLRTLMHREDVCEVINACDAGREGELIFRTAYNLNNCRKRVKRLWISSMEDAAILQGFDNLRDGAEYDNLYASALCRSKADWLVGINATRLFSVMYHRTLNVGRVVSPTLALLVQREAEINAFQPETFYTVHLDFNGFSAAGGRMKEQAEAERLAGDCNSKTAAVTSVVQTKKTEKAPALYDLTTLQRDANRLLGYTAQQTLDYLQSLYEKKLCTYPRTDSRYLTDDMEGGVNALALCCAGVCGTEPPAAVCSGAGVQQQKGQRPPRRRSHDGGGRNRFGNLARRRTGDPAPCFPSGAYGGQRALRLSGDRGKAGLRRKCLCRQRENNPSYGLEGIHGKGQAGQYPPGAFRGTVASRFLLRGQRGKNDPAQALHGRYPPLRHGDGRKRGYARRCREKGIGNPRNKGGGH